MRALYGVLGPHQFQTGAPCAGGPSPAPAGPRTGFDLGDFAVLRLGQLCGKVGREKVGETFGQVCAVHLVVNDPEAGEDGLVELSAYVERSADVQSVCVGAE
ncbi:hypothetical protein [Amycolatopsis sp. NPDC051102]|uniref:hypothetical protein n=1 Tax=Amycolatopsis sp. NPDC051102 TaxID=3155163 RepID=UPI00341E91AA